MRRSLRRVITLFLTIVLGIAAIPAIAPTQVASASSKYITVGNFIEYLVTEMKLPVDQTSQTPYLDAAMKAGILSEGDFQDYSSYLTRTDCAVLANRADEYIYGAHYGFSDGVYEFLKGCEYFQGKLFYNTKGDLYPEGETFVSYKASTFLNEVLNPILDPYFKFEKGLRARYEDVFNEDDSIRGQYIMLGHPSPNPYNEIAIEPFNDNDYLIQAWKKIIDGDRRVKAVYDLRISDLKKITKSKRQDVAEIVAKGIIKGYSNGVYVQNREFRGSKKITASGAKGVVALVLDQYSRARISPDGQLIRTTNLPKNHSEFPYILECFPNDFYEMKYSYAWMNKYKDGTMDKSEYDHPIALGNEGLIKRYERRLSLGMKPYEYFDTIMEKANQYLECVFKVDYRTINQEWIDKLADSYVPFGGTSIYEDIYRYVDVMKKNHVIVENQLISVEPSTLYRYTTNFYVRAYVKYRVTADTVKVDEDYDLIFGDMASTYLVGINSGVWTYGYYDIMISGSNINDQSYMEFGVDSWVGISDAVYKGKKQGN